MNVPEVRTSNGCEVVHLVMQLVAEGAEGADVDGAP
jgi:uncharacterized protein YvpB